MRPALIVKLGALFLFIGCVSSPPLGSSRGPASLDGVEIVVHGSGDTPVVHPTGAPIIDPESYDAVVVGGGLSGLSAAVYLTDRGHRVLLLEKEAAIGGLAAWSDGGSQIVFDRGAAYWTDAYEEEQEILNHIGLKDYRKVDAIPEPIDSYYVRGKFYPGIWEAETMQSLPASFALFHFQLQRADAQNMIPNQPFEDFANYGGRMDLDSKTTQQWIEEMPAMLEQSLPDLEAAAKNAPESAEQNIKTNPHFALSEARRVLARFQQELNAHKLAGNTGMQGVVELMDLYCRSALGGVSKEVSAMAFANFYISEIDTRYTSPQGTGIAADNMVKMLTKRKKLVRLLTEAPVLKIVPRKDFAETHYVSHGRAHEVHSKYVVFAAQLGLAPQLIEGFTTEAPEQAGLMNNLGYSNYSVHAVHVDGHPYRATYDTWMYPENYSADHPTDVILGRWMDPKFPGYLGYRDFKKDPPDRSGILTIYHPLSEKWMTKDAYTSENAKRIAKDATQYVTGMINSLPPTLYRGPITVTKIETNMWPISVHVPAPGHYLERASIMRRPFKQIFFGNNNLGAPAFEEALFRGHCAAVNILLHLDKDYQREKWSRCPVDK